TMVYAVRLLQANNAYLTRHLLDLGLLQTATAEAPETPTEDATAPTE
ncbi:MAG: hypothetical protein QOF01_2589, partial [Thermomicrobiales bacterium]|nr:hypothetical protein [Thermomicrobiales bacterium]